MCPSDIRFPDRPRGLIARWPVTIKSPELPRQDDVSGSVQTFEDSPVEVAVEDFYRLRHSMYVNSDDASLVEVVVYLFHALAAGVENGIT